MIDVNLYNSTSEKNALDKDLINLTSLSGILKDDTSILNPVIDFNNISQYLLSANYAYIPSFGRYYFINDIEIITNNMIRLYLHVDVLTTYADQIRTNSGIVARNQNEYDLKLNDGLFKTQQNPRISQHLFPSGFNHWNFVLAIAGN